MDDVFAEVVLSRRDEDLGAGNRIATVRLRIGAGLQQPEIGTAVRLSQVHRSGPAAGDHVGNVALLQFVRRLHEQRGDRAGGQPLVHFEAVVGGKDIFADGGADDLRQPLPAIFLGRSEGRPAGFAELLVCVLEAGRGGYRAIVGALAASFVAYAVQGLKHFLAKSASLFENSRDEVGRGVGEAGEVRVAADVENAIQYEKRVFHR